MTRNFVVAVGALALAALLIVCPFADQGAAGAVSRSTSSIFQVVPTPNENFNSDLQAASASSPSDIWAVGQSTIHFDGTKWTAFPAPMIKGNNTSYLGGVADISPTLAWAVGTVNIGSGTLNQVIEQWNGSAWSVYPGPTFAPGDQPSLTAMTTISSNDIWAVGSLLFDDGNALAFLFEHWNGTNWTATTASNAGAFLMGASSDATNDVWAVGYSGFTDSSSTVVYHYNGSIWEDMPSANVGVSSTLNGVVALAPNNVWAVGSSIGATGDPTLTLIENYNGSTWSVVPSPNVGPMTGYQSNRLFGITAVSSTDIWAFGSYFAASGSGHQMTLLLHWDGNTWNIAPSPNPTKSDFLSDLLWAGVVPSPGNVWIVGTEDEAPHGGTLAIHTTTGSSR